MILHQRKQKKTQPEPANNPRRHGTRNRPPTAKALEAVAFGFLGSGKRKGDPKNAVTNRPSQLAKPLKARVLKVQVVTQRCPAWTQKGNNGSLYA
jgi:hypothetical protein